MKAAAGILDVRSTAMTQREKRAWNAAKNRRELIEARFTRRDLVKMGLLTSAGYLVSKDGLSAEDQTQSPPTTPFIEPLPTVPVKQPVASLSPAPTVAPNTAAGEGRRRPHQAFTQFVPCVPDKTCLVPQKFYEIHQREGHVSVSPNLPMQFIWGYDGITPGPIIMARYGEPILVRQVNDLPPPGQNRGFGFPSVSTHLHNGHTPAESDGNPCDFFGPFDRPLSHFYDHHYPNALAGFKDTHPPLGDPREMMSFLWYHDHRVDFTSQNVYKGLAGFYLLFNEFDPGNETTGFRLPTFPTYDIPMMFADKCFDPTSKLLAFDLFNLDGILGDKFLVNGVIQPVLHVSPRRYRFRWLNTGPSRFVQMYLTDLGNPSITNMFWQISNDGNLLPTPVQVPAVALGVAERADVIIDFAPFAGRTLHIENRLEQTNGQGPSGNVLAAGTGNLYLKIVVDGPTVADNSVNPASGPLFYSLPSTSAQPRVRRSFNFDRTRNGQWVINDQFFNCDTVRFTVQQNSVEQWELDGGFGWSHPVHIHFEEFQILSGAPGLFGSSGSSRSFSSSNPSTGVNLARKDVVRLIPRGNVLLFFRFRDFLGRYPMHCHNVIHEDHAMMLPWDI